ncbi:hypothetical protein AOLI_G00137950 [Acnodon oligacanthus]
MWSGLHTAATGKAESLGQEWPFLNQDAEKMAAAAERKLLTVAAGSAEQGSSGAADRAKRPGNVSGSKLGRVMRPGLLYPNGFQRLSAENASTKEVNDLSVGPKSSFRATSRHR